MKYKKWMYEWGAEEKRKTLLNTLGMPDNVPPVFQNLAVNLQLQLLTDGGS